MNRNKKLILNTSTSLLHQLISVICGFILPRVLLTTYGSTVNGLVSSVSQFLGFISLCEMGVGAVVQSALYKPLAEGDAVGISKIAVSSERFFRKIAYILLVYTLVLMFVLPLKTIDDFSYGYTMLLVVVMSISFFAQYYFGMTYRLILTADQLGFLQFIVNSVTLILNTIASVVLANAGASIQVLKLTTSMIFLLQPISLSLIAKRKYKIDRKIELTEEPIKQKWNGLAQHVAAVVLGNTGTVVLTLFSSLNNVSIYAVYNLVVTGVKELIRSLTNGVQAMFGNMLARNEENVLNKAFESFEWLMHTGVTVIFSATALLIVPFVSVYTKGVTDVNYIIPIFAYLLVFATAAYCLRLPYNIMVLSAGHYKQTQSSAIIEAVINIVLSVALVIRFELMGVAIGTLVSMLYRTVYLAWYLRKNIINRKFKHFVKHFVVDVIIVVTIILVYNFANNFFVMGETTYFAWVILAVKVGVVCVLITGFINLIFYQKFIIEIVKFFVKKLKRK